MKEIAKRLTLLSATLLVTLLVADVLYRWIVEPEPVVPKAVGRFDDTLGWALRPNSSGRSTATGTKVHYAINSHGLCDDETTIEKPPGTLRIALLGDSRTFGYGVPIEQHFSRLLEGHFTKVEALNLGVSGYGVDQELLALRLKGLRYEPDIVIAYVAHFGDQRHVFDTRFGRGKPLFQVAGDTLVLTNVPVPPEDAGMDLPHRIDARLTDFSPLYRDASRITLRVLKKILGRSAPPAAPAPSVKDTTFANRLYSVALAILRQADRDARAAGAHFVLVTQLPRLHREAQRAGLRSFDVTAPLANDRFELPNDLQHINEAGNGVLAWEIARLLLEAGLVPAAHQIDAAARAEAGS